jgi:hypothetical protein
MSHRASLRATTPHWSHHAKILQKYLKYEYLWEFNTKIDSILIGLRWVLLAKPVETKKSHTGVPLKKGILICCEKIKNYC